MKIQYYLLIGVVGFFSLSIYAQQLGKNDSGPVIRILVGKPVPYEKWKDHNKNYPGLASFKIPHYSGRGYCIPSDTSILSVTTFAVTPDSVTLGKGWGNNVEWNWQEKDPNYGPGKCTSADVNKGYIGDFTSGLQKNIEINYYYEIGKAPMFAYKTDLSNTTVMSGNKTYNFAGCMQDSTHIKAYQNQYGYPYNSYIVCEYK